jgi:1-deoxy-D-xylulose-5-phosphate reductoisomerase
LAYQALRAGGTAPALLNAANEEAVAAFLERRISFLDIPRLIETVLGKIASAEVEMLQDLLDADASARAAAREWIAR